GKVVAPDGGLVARDGGRAGLGGEGVADGAEKFGCAGKPGEAAGKLPFGLDWTTSEGSRLTSPSKIGRETCKERDDDRGGRHSGQDPAEGAREEVLHRAGKVVAPEGGLVARDGGRTGFIVEGVADAPEKFGCAGKPREAAGILRFVLYCTTREGSWLTSPS